MISAIEPGLLAMSPASQRSADAALACPPNAVRVLADAPVTDGETA